MSAERVDPPDRTPPSKAPFYTGKRRIKRCAVCAGPFQIAASMAHSYHTCSSACTFALRSRQRSARQQGQPHPHRGHSGHDR